MLGGLYVYSDNAKKSDAASAAASEQQAKPSSIVVEPDTTPATAESLLVAVNAERAKVGTTPLQIDERLNKSAQAKADDMRARGYREHVDPDGKHGYTLVYDYAPGLCSYSSENLYYGSQDGVAVPSVVPISAWMASEKHKQAMLDSKYSYTGFGVNGNLVVEHFCQP